MGCLRNSFDNTCARLSAVSVAIAIDIAIAIAITIAIGVSVCVCACACVCTCARVLVCRYAKPWFAKINSKAHLGYQPFPIFNSPRSEGAASDNDACEGAASDDDAAVVGQQQQQQQQQQRMAAAVVAQRCRQEQQQQRQARMAAREGAASDDDAREGDASEDDAVSAVDKAEPIKKKKLERPKRTEKAPHSNSKVFLPFQKALVFARSLNLTGQIAWNTWCKSGERPDDIPSAPYKIYEHDGWDGYGHWLGTGNKHGQTFPRDGYGHWLGTGNIHGQTFPKPAALNTQRSHKPTRAGSAQNVHNPGGIQDTTPSTSLKRKIKQESAPDPITPSTTSSSTPTTPSNTTAEKASIHSRSHRFDRPRRKSSSSNTTYT